MQIRVIMLSFLSEEDVERFDVANREPEERTLPDSFLKPQRMLSAKMMGIPGWPRKDMAMSPVVNGPFPRKMEKHYARRCS